MREGLTLIIESQADLQVVAEAGTGKQAIACFEEHLTSPVDLGLPDMHGIDVIKRLRAQHPEARINFRHIELHSQFDGLEYRIVRFAYFGTAHQPTDCTEA